MRCTCPHYHIPSADPNDSRGCPEHDPDYVDPQDKLNALRAELKELREAALPFTDNRIFGCACMGAGPDSIDGECSCKTYERKKSERLCAALGVEYHPPMYT